MYVCLWFYSDRPTFEYIFVSWHGNPYEKNVMNAFKTLDKTQKSCSFLSGFDVLLYDFLCCVWTSLCSIQSAQSSLKFESRIFQDNMILSRKHKFKALENYRWNYQTTYRLWSLRISSPVSRGINIIPISFPRPERKNRGIFPEPTLSRIPFKKLSKTRSL